MKMVSFGEILKTIEDFGFFHKLIMKDKIFYISASWEVQS